MITSCILFLLAYDNHLKKDVACLCLLNMQRPFLIILLFVSLLYIPPSLKYSPFNSLEF